LLLKAAGFDEIHVQARGNPLTVACYKTMALFLMLLYSSSYRRHNFAKIVLGLLLTPVLGMLACIGNLSLGGDWGDDCLGYTVTARRKA
jgi:hypothetical protein